MLNTQIFLAGSLYCFLYVYDLSADYLERLPPWAWLPKQNLNNDDTNEGTNTGGGGCVASNPDKELWAIGEYTESKRPGPESFLVYLFLEFNIFVM